MAMTRFEMLCGITSQTSSLLQTLRRPISNVIDGRNDTIKTSFQFLARFVYCGQLLRGAYRSRRETTSLTLYSVASASRDLEACNEYDARLYSYYDD
jgi:hypothetical protein